MSKLIKLTNLAVALVLIFTSFSLIIMNIDVNSRKGNGFEKDIEMEYDQFTRGGYSDYDRGTDWNIEFDSVEDISNSNDV